MSLEVRDPPVAALTGASNRQPFNLSARYLASRCGVSFILQMSEAATLAIVVVLFARILGSVAFGHYAYALTLATILVMIARLGFDVTSVRFISQYVVAKQYALLKGFLRFTARSVLVIAFIVVAVFLSTTLFCKGSMEAGLFSCFLAAAALIPCLAALHVLTAVLRGYNRVLLSRLPQGAVVPAVLLGGACIALFSKMHGGNVPAWTLVGLHVAAVCCGVAVSILWIRETVRRLPATDSPQYESRKWIKSAGLLVLLGGLTKLHAEIDTLMLGAIQGTEAAGVYAIVTRIGGVPMLICVAMTAIVSPAMAGLASLGESSKLLQLYRNSVLLVAAASMPVAAVLCILGKPLLAFVGQDFAAGYYTLLILLASNVIHNLFGPVGVLLNMAGHEWATVRIFALSVALNAALNLLLIPQYGLAGAAAGTSFVLLLIQFLLTIEVWRKIGLPTPALICLNQALRGRLVSRLKGIES